MKKTLIYLPLGALALLASCNFLDKPPLTTLTPNSFFQTSTDAEASLTATYDALQLGGGVAQDLTVMGEVPSDNCTSTNGDVNAMEKIIWVSTTNQVNNVYRDAFIGVNRANIVLKYVPTVSMDTVRRRQITGEARFIRALCYFNLVRAYGGVPLRTTPVEGGTPAEVNLARSTSDQVYAQVVADLTVAAAQMPLSNPNRATQNAANALLARVQLTQRNWAAAQAAAQKVISGGVALNSSFTALYPAENKGGESLFEIQFAGNADGGNLLPDEILPSPLATYSYPKFNIPTAELISYADTVNDLRWAYVGNVTAASGKLIGRSHASYLDSKPGTGGNSNDVGPFVYKWRSLGNGFNSVDNTYVLRYAEVLLTYAEASNEQNGPSGDALAKLNQVRQRAGLAALTAASPQALTKQALRNEIDRQRRLEMAFEGQRWFDLLRYARQTIADGTAQHAVTALDIIKQQRGAADVNYLLFPIPLNEINNNPLITQNPGF
ncbi:RagB/SusD family nutrient uptake outer membrane protein [Hymenobacter sp. UV11]|uniref:RagB/SusD family nutrient uptake outer membrane protein n=1 Tax=Hymenobacter sp. UV11 TaxID=1849735 RepID=UPI00105CA609|nr:RagB/SusD family nutrient uptake outer membrane protein [Hymenobacter sp. UV11]TDN36017.1 glycan metabolism protein [Hymenobacter sp. UV11]TFZ68164.1 RagB/SusD family nutrient uptake outer membrane protein [Hymenobacter sp. UV11]